MMDLLLDWTVRVDGWIIGIYIGHIVFKLWTWDMETEAARFAYQHLSGPEYNWTGKPRHNRRMGP